MIITLSSCFMVFRIFGRAFFTLLGSVCSQIHHLSSSSMNMHDNGATNLSCWQDQKQLLQWKRFNKVTVLIQTLIRRQKVFRRVTHNIPYSSKFSREKLLRILRFCGYSQKFSLRNLGDGVLWQKRAIHKNNVFHQFTQVFSLKCFLLYGSTISHHSLRVLVHVGHMPYQSWALFSSMFFHILQCIPLKAARLLQPVWHRDMVKK